jgi:hypothetical protein
MKLLSVLSARSTWLFNLGDLNPKGLRLFPQITDALTEAYDFDEQPDDAPLAPGETPAQPGIKFRNGQFETDQGPILVGLELYNDGIIAESSASTEVTDAFLQHAIDWAVQSFELIFDHSLVRERIHGSELSVQFAPCLSEVLKPLGAFAELLSNTSFNQPPQKYFPSGVTFATATGAAPFSIEKRANTSPEANVFYSKAMTDTKTHLSLLEQFERLLADQS